MNKSDLEKIVDIRIKGLKYSLMLNAMKEHIILQDMLLNVLLKHV